jgi:NADH:ubiquinone oxidoreductase, NADH-binding (51 kD) subunit
MKSTTVSASEPVQPPIGLSRLFHAGARAGYRSHLEAFGGFDAFANASSLLSELERSGLTGRGGAGFAAWRKLAATDVARTSRARSSRPILIANGAEGEPRSIKDSTLMRNAPHLVIDGILAVAAAVRASKSYVYATSTGLDDIRDALAERSDAGRIAFAEAPHTFISGEASAAVNSIENGIALPQDRIRRLSDSGIKRRPTLVYNVETLAHIGLVAHFGATWFRSAGTQRDPGTRLVTLSGDVPDEQVLEVQGDARLTDILRATGTDPNMLTAVLVGGYHGAWIPRDRLDANVSAEGLAPHGAQPGAGILYALGRHRCGLEATADIVDYLADESARQCGPCTFGLPEMAGVLKQIARGAHDSTLRARLRSLSETVAGRGSCHHPDGTARLALSALSVFADDVTQHLSGRCLRSARA